MASLNTVSQVPLDDVRGFLNITATEGWLAHCKFVAALDFIAFFTQSRFVILKRVPLAKGFSRVGGGVLQEGFAFFVTKEVELNVT